MFLGIVTKVSYVSRNSKIVSNYSPHGFCEFSGEIGCVPEYRVRMANR